MIIPVLWILVVKARAKAEEWEKGIKVMYDDDGDFRLLLLHLLLVSHRLLVKQDTLRQRLIGLAHRD